MLTKKRLIVLIGLLSIIIFPIEKNAVALTNEEIGGLQMEKTNRISSYRNISSAPSYLKFKIRDDEIFIVVLDNGELASFLGGSEYKKKVFLPPEHYLPANFSDFVKNEYLSFLIDKEGGKKEVKFKDFPINPSSMKKINEKEIKDFLNRFRCDSEMSLKDLGATSSDEMIKKYFNYNEKTQSGAIKQEYYEKYNFDSAFISLLIDLGYNPSRGDIVPVLCIKKW